MERQAITYRRVSTERQAKEGQSLAAQQDAVKAYCKGRGWHVARHFQDAGKSGTNREGRPGLADAIALCRERKGVLVVYSLSRLARSVIDASAILKELREAGADLAVVDMAMDTSTASGELIFNVFSAIAQFESQLIGERIRLVNERTVAAKGYRTQGEQPAGWTFDRELGRRKKVDAEWAIINRVEHLYGILGKASLVAEDMRLNGEPTISDLRGREDNHGWTPRKVRALLQSVREQRESGMI